MRTYQQDPSDRLEYWVTWEKFIGTDAIVSVAVDATEGLTANEADIIPAGVLDDVGGSHRANSVISLWVSGGVAGMTYQVTVTINTALNRTIQRSFYVLCIEM